MNEEVMTTPVEETAEVSATPEGIVTEETMDAFKLLSMKSQINDLTALATQVREQQAELSGSDDDIAFIDERIKDLTVDDIKNMPDKLIADLCRDENGEVVVGGLDDVKKDNEFRRDYLIFRKETNDALSGIDEETAKLNEAFAEYEADMDKILKEADDMTAYLKKTLAEKAEATEDEAVAQRYRDMITMIDKALTLEDVIEYYSNSFNARTAITNVIGPKKGKVTIKRYEKLISDLSCKTDFRRYGGIETKFLPEEYHEKHDDAFMFGIINYIASWYKNEDNTLNGLFLAQFSINLKNLIYNKFTNEEDKNTFINAIRKIVDLVG
jgi:hypothetical protein